MVQLYDADRYPIDSGNIVRFQGKEYIGGRISPGLHTIYLHPGTWTKHDEQIMFTAKAPFVRTTLHS
jgi:hypothetical protein